MAKIDELVEQARDELYGKEIYLEDLDNKIKTIFKTKKSALDVIKDWVIERVDDDILFTYNFYVQSGRYIIYITFKMVDKKHDVLGKIKLQLVDIFRMWEV